VHMRLIYWYLRIALYFGYKDYVYELSNKWGSLPKNGRRYGAAAKIQVALFDQGSWSCPQCYWATRIKNEHILKGEGWCYEQDLEERGIQRQKAFLVGTHNHSFRPGKPAEILGVEVIAFIGCPEMEARPCYLVRFEDGERDYVPVSDANNFKIISEELVRAGVVLEICG
jgi:hypothetical protein